jgi:ribose-phosphate pyrophosphokinase
MTSGKILFHTSSYQYLGDEILKYLPLEPGEIQKKIFPDGEVYHRILNDIEGKAVVLVGGTISDVETLELYDLACALVQNGAYSLTMILPFFGYSTMERAIKRGEVVKAKTRAMIISSVPQAPDGNKVMLLDLHTEGLPYYFESGVRPVHMYAKEFVIAAIKELDLGDETVLASTDAGRAKWVESLANELHLHAAFVFKKRLSGEETRVTSISADVRDKDVIIYDDMIRTGNSTINAAKAYRDAGAKNIYAIATHGLFNNNGLEKIKNSGLIRRVICTNSHPAAISLKDDFLQVKSVAGIIGTYLDNKF